MMSRLFTALVVLFWLLRAADAQSVNADLNGTRQAVRGAYPGMVAGSVLTRANDTTAYAANETVCALKSGTVCAPGTIAMTNVNGGRLVGNRVTLLKSGSSTTNASFTIWFYSSPPGVAGPNQFDATAYTGPRSGDMPNYLGNAACSTGVATSDTSPGVWYECTLSNPNWAGTLDLQAQLGTLNVYYLISVTGAYTPAAQETFTPYMGGVY